MPQDRRWIRFGPYCADLRARELNKHDTRMKLQARPFEILAMLLEQPGEVITRDEIRVRLWPEDTFVDFDNNISSAVRKLRDALCDSAAAPRYIETVGRVGYRFIAGTEFIAEQQAHRAARPGSEPTSAGSAVSSVATVSVTEEAVDAPATSASSELVTLDATRLPQVRYLRSIALVTILLAIGLLVPVAKWSRRRLSNVSSAGKASPGISHSAEYAAKEYSIGRDFWDRRGEEPLKDAIEHFNLAIEKQPDYGLAYSGLADAYVLLPFYSGFSAADAYAKARAAAIKAVELSPNSAEAHTSLAYVKFYADWDFSGSEEEFQVALRRNRNYATARQWHAESLSLEGRHDAAIAEITTAIQLMPDSAVMHHNAAQIYQAARRYDDAIEQYRIALRLDPRFATAYANMALAYMRKGMYDEAIQLLLQEASVTGDPTRLSYARKLADAYQSKGWEGYLRQLALMKIEENPERDSYRIAQCYALLGQKDLALQFLQRAYKSHSSELLSMNGDPELDSLRSEPEFLALRRQVGLPLQTLEF